MRAFVYFALSVRWLHCRRDKDSNISKRHFTHYLPGQLYSERTGTFNKGMLIYRNQNARTTNEITIGKSVKSWRSDSLMTLVHFPMILLNIYMNIVYKINDKCNSVRLQLKVIFGRSQGAVILPICNLLLHMFKTPLEC